MTLSTIERVLLLKGGELFGPIPSEELAPLAVVAEEVTFEAGETFIRQGEQSDSLYVLVAGEASIVIRGVGQVAVRGPKSVVGEMALLSGQPRSADCVALTPVTALRIDHDDFWELLEENPVLAMSVIRVLAERLDEAVGNLRRLGASPVATIPAQLS